MNKEYQKFKDLTKRDKLIDSLLIENDTQMMQLYTIANSTKKYLVIFLDDKYGEGINCEFEDGAEVRFFARELPLYEFLF